MKKALVIFGSKSDSKVFDPIVHGLKKAGIDVEPRICSAHRTPDELENILKNRYDIIIAGAGLSAALPGVVASKVICPVIGVPCHGNYEGLDALLSIMQMPPGIPVLGVGVENTDIAVDNAVKILDLKDTSDITIVADDKENERVKKALAILDEFDIKHKFSAKAAKDTVNIEFVYFDELKQKDELVVYCPLVPKEEDKAEVALNLLKHSNHGLWVGLNRAENAALAAIEILGNKEDSLQKYRQKMKQKVLDDDKEINS